MHADCTHENHYGRVCRGCGAVRDSANAPWRALTDDERLSNNIVAEAAVDALGRLRNMHGVLLDSSWRGAMEAPGCRISIEITVRRIGLCETCGGQTQTETPDVTP